MDLPPQQLFTEIYRIHGHRCPMSTLGGRLGYVARKRLASQKPLMATYFIDTCAADGISVMTGCNKAAGTLCVVAQNRHALWLQDDNDHGVFAELSSYALQLAGEYRTLDQTLQAEERGLAPEDLHRRQVEKAQFLENLLQRLWTLPDEELMNFITPLPASLASATRLGGSE